MEIHLKIFYNTTFFPIITCYVAMTSLQFHIFCSPNHTSIDEGPKLRRHNLIHAIKHISWWSIWSATLCRNCGIWVVTRDSLDIKTSKFMNRLVVRHKCRSRCENLYCVVIVAHKWLLVIGL